MALADVFSGGIDLYAYMRQCIDMPTLLVIKNLMFVLHTRDHGHPHVTVYLGNPESHEAMAKMRLDDGAVIEQKNFSQKSLNLIEGIVEENRVEWLEEWNDWFKNR